MAEFPIVRSPLKQACGYMPYLFFVLFFASMIAQRRLDPQPAPNQIRAG
jgi:hypothetical protein